MGTRARVWNSSIKPHSQSRNLNPPGLCNLGPSRSEQALCSHVPTHAGLCRESGDSSPSTRTSLESWSTEFPQAACTVTRTSPASVNLVVTELSKESRGCRHKQGQACLAGCKTMGTLALGLLSEPRWYWAGPGSHQVGSWRLPLWNCLRGVGGGPGTPELYAGLGTCPAFIAWRILLGSRLWRHLWPPIEPLGCLLGNHRSGFNPVPFTVSPTPAPAEAQVPLSDQRQPSWVTSPGL